MYSLKLCALKLSAAQPEAVLDDAEIDRLHDEVRDLLGEALRSSLAPDVRSLSITFMRSIGHFSSIEYGDSAPLRTHWKVPPAVSWGIPSWRVEQR